MSYPFQSAPDSTLIWDPGIGVGRAYVSFAEETGKSLGVPTGLTYSDRLGGSNIDVEVFQRFTQALYDRYTETGSFVLHGLLRGLLLPSLVMLERCGGTITHKPEKEAGLMEGYADYRRFM
ncbi:DUF6086 family protein [Streptomyces hydrogenans]|uniref:DUF6086 family protein n=1 Tax=Streptomyces hydrogenans TaxID=1873719 RepID=UPI00382C9E7B